MRAALPGQRSCGLADAGSSTSSALDSAAVLKTTSGAAVGAIALAVNVWAISCAVASIKSSAVTSSALRRPALSEQL